MAATVAAASSRWRPEAVVAFEADMAPYARLVADTPLLLEGLELSYLLRQHLQHRDPRRRLRYLLTALQHRRYIATLLRQFAAVTVVSEREAGLARQIARGRPVEVSVIPNGADVTRALAYSYEPEPDTLIYPGALSYAANLDAARYFVAESFPQVRALRPEARFRITGQSTPEQRAAVPPAPGVEFTGRVDDIHGLIARSAVEVVPLRQGGGTRLKILEALALGTPVVSTTKGVEGLSLAPGRDLIVADTPGAFAQATLRLLTHPEECARLSTAGRRAVVEQYDWRSIGGRFVALTEATAKQRGAAYAADAA